MPYVPMTPLPPPPLRSQAQTNFAVTAETFLVALPDFQDELNAAGVYFDATAAAAQASADDAAVQVGLAADQVELAEAQVVIATAQAVIATDQAVIATDQASLATTNGAAQVTLAEAQAFAAEGYADTALAYRDTAIAAAQAAQNGAGLPALSAGFLYNDGSTVTWVQADQSVGDTIKTARALTAPEYLPADMSVYLKSAYPDLATVVGSIKDIGDPITKTAPFVPVSIACGNGRILIADTSGNFAYSTDGGDSFTSSSIPVGYGYIRHVGGDVFLAFASSASTSAYRTTNGGASWSAVTMPSSQTWRELASDGTTVVAVTTSSITNAARSTDGGATFSAVSLSSAIPTQRAACNTSGTFVVVGASQTASVSTDYGATWSSVLIHNPSGYWDIDVSPSGRFVALGRGDGLSAYSDSPMTEWHSSPSGFGQAGAPRITYVDDIFVTTGAAVSKAVTIDGSAWFSVSNARASDAASDGTYLYTVNVTDAAVLKIPMYSYDTATSFAVPLTAKDPYGVSTYVRATA